MSLSRAVNGSLEPTLVELVKIRASQINGCANCINMHTIEARAKGETEQRHLPAVGLARGAGLQPPRARRPCLDRGADPAVARDTPPRGRLRRARGAFHRGGAGEAHAGRQRHQRLEPARRRLRHVVRHRRRGRGGVTDAAGSDGDAAAAFDPLRPRLVRVAYRMLGSVADAEDVVQEAFIRWMGADRAAVREPEAFLRRTVTRLCLDQLRSARRRREVYVGPWLPEPVVEEEAVEDDVTLPLMLALERLSPLERAAFLLHDVFGVGFEEVAETLDRARRRAGSSRRGRGRTSARSGRGSGWRRRAGWRSPRPSSPPRGTATWSGSARCSPRTSASTPTAAASGPAAGQPILGFEAVTRRLRVARDLVRAAAVGAGADRLRQRPAGLRHPRGRRRAADDGARGRGRQGRGDLRDAEPGEAPAPALDASRAARRHRAPCRAAGAARRR